MLIVCPNCATSYMIDQASLGAAGRTVRCTRCTTSWFAGGPEIPAEAVAVAETVAAEAPPVAARRERAEAPPAAPEPAPVLAASEPEPPEVPAAATTDPVVPEPEPAPAPAATEAPPVEPPAAPQEDQVAEATPVIVTDAPPLAPPVEHEAQPDVADAEAAASFEARRRLMQARRKKSRRSSRWTAVILVLVAFNVAMVGARNEVVRYLPQTASLFAAVGLPVNLRSLKFENVRLSTEDVGGTTMLTVQGSIVSEAGKAVSVPRLRFAVRNTTGQEVYTWTMAPPNSILEAGARTEFRSQIPVPNVDATDVLVRFLTAQDVKEK